LKKVVYLENLIILILNNDNNGCRVIENYGNRKLKTSPYTLINKIKYIITDAEAT